MTASPTFLNLPPDKQERVLAEAEQEFAARGYHGASMNSLAKRLDIAKGSLFQYFGSKEGCLQAVFDLAVERFARRMRRARTAAAGATAREAEPDFFTTLQRLMDAALDFVAEQPRIFRIYLKMQSNEDFPLREGILRQVRRNVRRLLEPALLAAQERGELRPDLDLETALFAIATLTERLLQEALPPEGNPEQARATVVRVLELLRLGLAPR